MKFLNSNRAPLKFSLRKSPSVRTRNREKMSFQTIETAAIGQAEAKHVAE